jgi:hypothetical protein
MGLRFFRLKPALRKLRRNEGIASRLCDFSALVSKMRLPAPKLCSSIARRLEMAMADFEPSPSRIP